MAEKLLDILVPVYGDVGGLKKILAVVSVDQRCSIIVSDDSSKSVDIISIKQLCVRYGAIYKTGPRRGAVANWNFLLSLSSSTYSVLIHHDEHFSNTTFIDELEARQSSIEAMVLPVVIINCNNVARYVYSWQQSLLIRWFKSFGPMVNMLAGPTALLIFKTTKARDFNSKLVYQVDCEWYTRVLSGVDNSSICFYDGTRVISTFLSGSITDTIKGNLKEVIKSDKKVLQHSQWADIMTRWLYCGHCVTFFYKLVLLPSFVPFYLKRIWWRANAHR